MRLSQSIYKTSKEVSAAEKSINAQYLLRAGMIHQEMAGVYTYLPMGLRVLKKIEQIIREEINAVGGQELFMPALQPKKNRDKTDRRDTLDCLFKFESFYSKNDYALGPTHEEIVTPLLKDFVTSYKNLPLCVYQFQNKFRDELRAKSGILRGREFYMKDAYSFHTSQDDLDDYYPKMQEAYKNIYKRIGIGDVTYMTYASGGSFSKYSHEYQTLTESGEDIIYIDEKSGLAVNKEIIDDSSIKKELPDAKFTEKKAIEVGNIFKLGNKFSSCFDFTVTNENNKQSLVFMGCYGIGVSRVMGAVVEVLHDNKGIIWPETIAPYKYVIISIGKDGHKRAEELYNKMIKEEKEVIRDDREMGPGGKFADADLIGYPRQIVIGNKTLEHGDKAELIERKTGNKQLKEINSI